jgi:hypothetical protein
MQKSTTFTTIFRVKKGYFHYDFACKKVALFHYDMQKKYECFVSWPANRNFTTFYEIVFRRYFLNS